MVIDVINLDKAIRKFENAENVDFLPYVQKATQLVQRTAKTLAPVSIGQGPQARPETRARGMRAKRGSGGHLRRNINRKTERVGKSGVIGKVYNPVEYAPYQEFGTSKMRPQPFLYPAMRMHEKDILKGMEDTLSSHLRRIVR
jgi:HK97 gp10 family phage protein